MYSILDIEDFSSDNNVSKKVILNNTINDTYKTNKGILVFKPEHQYYSIDELRTLLIDFELKQYLYDNEETRKEMKKVYPNI